MTQGMDADDWDARYVEKGLLWSAEPNRFVEDVVAPLPPGRALDVAAGEGRNAIWMAERGWQVTATDFSPVAVERTRRLAAERLRDAPGRLVALVADSTQPSPGEHAAYDLVLFCYLQLPQDQWHEALRHGVAAAAPGAVVLVVVHARRNLTEGYGGPQDPTVLHDPEDVVETVRDLPVDVESAELRTRLVPTEEGDRGALDSVVVLRRRP
jgi:SAM-dependent methyltransferase